MRKVHSYDVFDTVLTRVVGDPDAVIDVVARSIDDEQLAASAKGLIKSGYGDYLLDLLQHREGPGPATAQ